MNNKCIKNSKVFKAFCDENRLYILELLKNGEMCGCKLIDITNIKQSRLSYHMKILTEAKVVTVRNEGKWSFYSINNNVKSDIISLIEYYLS